MTSCFLSYLVIATCLNEKLSMGSNIHNWDQSGAGLSGDTVYGFGSGKRGQLGVSMDNIISISLPQATVGLKCVEIVSIDANGDHSASLSGRQLKLLDL